MLIFQSIWRLRSTSSGWLYYAKCCVWEHQCANHHDWRESLRHDKELLVVKEEEKIINSEYLGHDYFNFFFIIWPKYTFIYFLNLEC